MSRRGQYVTFDGCEGAGKTTISKKIAANTGALWVREPGQTNAGATIREILNNDDTLPSLARVLLLSADRHLTRQQVIEPTLRSGQSVVADRSYLSTLAYQGFGEGMDQGDIIQITTLALGGLERRPQRAVILDIPYETGMQRLIEQGRELDVIEKRDQAFHDRVRNGFYQISQRLGDIALLVDASGTVDEVYQQVETGIGPLLRGESCG